MRPTWRKIWWTALILAGLCLISSGIGIAQDQDKEKSGNPGEAIPAGQVDARPSEDGSQHFGRQLAKESREAAGEDENAQFKQSSSVKLVARITGLSLQQAYWFCLIVNFGIVAGLIVWVSKKSLPGVFRNRTAQIQQAMEEARRASAEANQRLAEIGSRLSRLDGEIAEMRAAAEKAAAAEEARIKAAAEEDARKIIQTAEQEIAAATKAARRELTAYAASLAVSLAGKQIHVDQAADQALVRDFAAQLGADGNSRQDDN